MEAILTREVVVNRQACRLIGIASFLSLTALGAFVRVPLPFTPVPLTLQTMFVLLSGALLGGRLGAVTQISYIFLGVLGFPIFTGMGSVTAGYLFGFIIASYFLGNSLKHSGGNLRRIFCLFCIADFMILFSGAVWLKFVLGINTRTAVFIGIMPFIVGDILKIAVACGIYTRFASRCKEIF